MPIARISQPIDFNGLPCLPEVAAKMCRTLPDAEAEAAKRRHDWDQLVQAIEDGEIEAIDRLIEPGSTLEWLRYGSKREIVQTVMLPGARGSVAEPWYSVVWGLLYGSRPGPSAVVHSYWSHTRSA